MLSICSPQLGLSPESNSGGEVYDREVIDRLCQKNCKVFTLLPRGRTYPKHKNLEVKHALIRSMVPPHVFSSFACGYMIKTYLNHRFSILRIHNPYFLGPAAIGFKKLFPKVPIVASYLHLESGVNQLISLKVIKSFNHIITISKSTKNEIIDTHNYPKSKITVAYPGVDKKFKPNKKPNNATTILFLGGLKPRKNLFFLLKVFKNLKDSKVKIIMAGTGPLLLELKAKAKTLGIANQIMFTGFIKESEKVSLYQSADILVLPSLKEGFGMTITEAAACAVPAVGADHYSTSEIIKDKQTGLLANPNDVNDWTEKLIQLIKDKKLRQQMGHRAQQWVTKTFTWNKNIQTHIKIFNQLIKKR